MKTFSLFIFCVLLPLCALSANEQAWQPSSGHKQIPIWPAGKMPDPIPITKPEKMLLSHILIAKKTVISVMDVTQPTITIYSPTTKNTGTLLWYFLVEVSMVWPLI